MNIIIKKMEEWIETIKAFAEANKALDEAYERWAEANKAFVEARKNAK